jgi:lysyl-tRNA synthetase class I
MAIKVAQKRHYYNFNLDPKGARHSMLKMYLLSVMEENNAKIVGFSKHINDRNAKGTVEQSIIQRIQSVRRYLRTLTPEEVSLQLEDKVSFRFF